MSLFNWRNVLVVVAFENNYNKNIPPIESSEDGKAIPANVSISITLMKVVEIEERDHSIHLQFEINFRWKENRVTYNNLKNETSLNALRYTDIEELWLPLIIYDNTDQKDSTRLGEYGNGECSEPQSLRCGAHSHKVPAVNIKK